MKALCRRGALGVVLAACAATARLVRADDLTVVQQVEGSGTSGQMTLRFHEEKMRADVSVPWSILTDGATGETLYLHHTHQTFSRLTAEEAARLGEQVRAAQAASPPGLLFTTGEKRKFGTATASLYTWSIGAMKMRFWISQDFPNAASLQARLDRWQQTGLAAATAGLLPSAERIPGVRLRTEVESKGQKISSTILSATAGSLPPELFAIPAGYHEIPFALPANFND